MRKSLFLVVGTWSLLAAAPALAATYYVAATGTDTAVGSQAAPFGTLAKANSTAAAGDTIYVRGGTYYITSQVVLSKSGTSDANRTKIWAYPGETPVLDAHCAKLPGSYWQDETQRWIRCKMPSLDPAANDCPATKSRKAVSL